MKRRITCLAAAALGLMGSSPAWAHPGHGAGTGFMAGLGHPLTGADHLAAMVLVGLWAGLLPRRALLLLPASFLGAMIAGFASGALLTVNATEVLIIVSVLALGVAAALRVRAPLPLAAIAVALFGFAHGQAHGLESPQGALPFIFAAGFALSTAALHGFGCWLAAKLPEPAIRLCGAAGAVLGLALASTA